MNRREEEMDEQLEVFNKRVNQQLLGFVDARSFFFTHWSICQTWTRVDFTTTNNEFHFLVSPKSAKNLRQELLHSLEKADFSPEDVPRMLHQAVALHSGRHEEVVVEEEGAEMVGRIPGLGIRVSSPLPQVPAAGRFVSTWDISDPVEEKLRSFTGNST